MNLLEFEHRLKVALIEELEACQDRFSNEVMLAFDLGCHPWHGYLEPSFLTTTEPEKILPEEKWQSVGSWKLYNFPYQGSGWLKVAEIEKWMQTEWTNSSQKQATAGCFFQLCARVVMSNEVIQCLKSFHLALDFEAAVMDPDDSTFTNYIENTLIQWHE